jgi:hypothetical protein
MGEGGLYCAKTQWVMQQDDDSLLVPLDDVGSSFYTGCLKPILHTHLTDEETEGFLSN